MVASDAGQWLSVARLGTSPAAQLRGRIRRVTADEVKIEAHRSTITMDDARGLAARLPAGQFQPPAAAFVPGRGYVILAGERRWAAMLLRNEPLFIVRV